MLVHKIDRQGYFVVSMDIADGKPIPKNCVPAALPTTVTTGKSLQWVGKWIEVDPVTSTDQKILVETDAILNRFKPEEQLRIKLYIESAGAPEAYRGMVFSFYNRLLTGQPFNVLSPKFKTAIEFLNQRTVNSKKLVEDDYPQRILFEQLS